MRGSKQQYTNVYPSAGQIRVAAKAWSRATPPPSLQITVKHCPFQTACSVSPVHTQRRKVVGQMSWLSLQWFSQKLLQAPVSRQVKPFCPGLIIRMWLMSCFVVWPKNCSCLKRKTSTLQEQKIQVLKCKKHILKKKKIWWMETEQ